MTEHATDGPREQQQEAANPLFAKAMTVRLSVDQAEELATVASVDGGTVSEVIRTAIAEYIDKRKRDSAFQDELQSRIERIRRMLGRTREETP